MIMVVRAVLGAGLACAAALGALIGWDQVSSPSEPGQVAQAAVNSPAPDPAAPPPATRFDRFIAPDGGENLASAANAACGYSQSLSAGGTLLRVAGEPERGLGVYQADAGDGGALRSFTAPAGAAQAFVDDGGSLYIQTGAEARNGFNSRVFVLDEEGFPTFSEPMQARSRIALECADPQGAADQLNSLFAESGGGVDRVRAGVRAFEVGRAPWIYPRVEAFTAACTSDQTLADLPADALFVLKTEFHADAVYGDSIENHISGEYLGGTPEPMIYVTLASINDERELADIHQYSIPLFWSFLPLDETTVSPVFRFDAIEARGWVIGPDGERGHSLGGSGVESVRIPCRDPAAGAAALEAVRDNHRAR